MNVRKRKSYRKLLRELREICPPLVPVRTRRRKLKDCMGYTSLTHSSEGDELPLYFVITLDIDLSWEATWQLLVHEWAHCLAWRQDHANVTDHGAEFGLAYAQVWGDVVEL